MTIDDPRRQWSTVNELLHPGRRDRIPSNSTDDARLANGFSAFIVDKLRSIQVKIASKLSASAAAVHGVPVVQSPPLLYVFTGVTSGEVSK